MLWVARHMYMALALALLGRLIEAQVRGPAIGLLPPVLHCQAVGEAH